MDVFRTGLGITRTFKNANRLREILSVLAINGFDEFIIRTKLHDKIPGFALPKARIKTALSEVKGSDFWGGIGYRLRRSFESLGPGFIKLGQLISSREDLFDPAFIKELKKLQNNVKALPFQDFEKVIESSLGGKPTECFKNFSPEPIATASISSVFKATLKNDKEVVVKVRKPGIHEVIDTDFELFKVIIAQIEKISEDFKYLGLSRIINDFHRTVLLELNFIIERKNLIKLKRNIDQIDTKKILKIPEAYEDLSSEDVLVMDYVEGVPFNSLSPKDLTSDLEEKLLACTEMFLQNMLFDGFFHADLHGGNFLLLKDGSIGIIDFGSVGTLSKANKASLISILYSLSTDNYENLVYEFLDIADYEAIPNHQSLTRDIQQNLSPFVGLSANELNITELMSALMGTLREYKLYLPREWYIIFRAMITLDGVGKSLDFDLNIFEIIEKDSEKMVKMLISKDQLIEDSLWFSRDMVNSIRILPKHLTWFLKEASKKNYALEVKSESFEESINQVSKSLYFLGRSLVTSVLIFSGVYLIKDVSISRITEIPRVTLFLWISAVMLIGYTLFKSSNSQK